MELLFWVSAGIILYVYAGYPLLLALLARLKRADHAQHHAAHLPQVTYFVSAYNEEAVIGEKLRNALELDYPADRLEIVVISDASSDATDAIVREFAPQGVILLRMPERCGKTLGLNAGVAAAHGEVLVFSDANAMYQRGALRALVARFADPRIGAVTGESRYRAEGAQSAVASESAYWRYEQWIKRLESEVGSLVGGDGAIYAVRRALFRPLLAADLSDFVNPLQVVAQGYRNVYEPRAVCYEEGGETFAKEYRRKVRIVNRAWRATLRMAGVLNPLRHGFVSLQLWSHKVLRWLVPVFMALALVSNIALFDDGLLYRLTLAGQLLFYGAAVLGALLARSTSLPKLIAGPYYFCLANAASLQGILEYFAGRDYTTWKTVRQA
jgi:cellulose synthase/poly-beta-1,6-N-acetylglucosamine synthase-like glycosyltransferase